MKETGWIIFFDYKKTRYYFEKFRLERCIFDDNNFCLYSDLLDCNNDLIKIEESLKKYSTPFMKKHGLTHLKLKAAQVTVTNKEGDKQ